MFESDTRIIALTFATSLAPILVAFFAAGRLHAAQIARDPGAPLPSYHVMTVGFFLGGLGGAIFGVILGPSVALDPFLSAAASGPLAEELGKGLLPLALYATARLPHRATGLGVGLVVGAGFAAVENSLFAIESYASGGEDEWMLTIQLRLAFGSLIHMAASGLFGAAIGEAASSSRRWVRGFGPLAGCLAALLVHGGWNACVVLAEEAPAWAVGAQVVALAAAVAVGVLYADGVRLPRPSGDEAET